MFSPPASLYLVIIYPLSILIIIPSSDLICLCNTSFLRSILDLYGCSVTRKGVTTVGTLNFFRDNITAIDSLSQVI